MSRRRFATAVLATCFLLVPFTGAAAGRHALHASAAAKSGRSVDSQPLPVIKRVKPLRLELGGTLTIIGRHFLPGKGRNTVVFFREGAPAIFLRAGRATKTRIKVKLTSKLGKYLIGRNNGERGPTRFRLRVLTTRFGAHFTPLKLSPIVLPVSHPDDQRSGETGPPAPVCSLASAAAAPQADADGDALSNELELRIKTDPCLADTDADTIPDGYEYEAALDYNSRALPYPGKRPYPNPLDPTDANTDRDGDGLLMSDEYAAWVLYGHSSFPLNYSDGTQTSGGPVQVTVQTAWEDINGDGFLTDDEKDVDGDGLTNWDEAHGRMVPEWWQGAYPSEPAYPLSYLQTNWLDPDSDGDTLLDGPDDVDEDGWTNADEVLRGPYWVQPFNPCLPDYASRSCMLHPPFDNPPPPFRPGDVRPGELPPLAWPR
jgi:hypothetical protein